MLPRPSGTFPIPSDTVPRPSDTFLKPSDTFPRPLTARSLYSYWTVPLQLLDYQSAATGWSPISYRAAVARATRVLFLEEEEKKEKETYV